MKYDEMIKSWKRKEEGAVAVIVAFAMIGLMASAALAIDLGMATYKISKLQNAMDSAVLAAVQELPAADTSSPEWTSAAAIATEYAQKNGIDHVAISPVYRSGKIVGAQATSDTLVEYTFAKVLGKESGTYNRDATAKKKPVSGMSGIVPLAAWEELMTTNGGIEAGDTITLKVGVEGQREYPGSGWFGALDFPASSGGHDYNYYLTNGYDGKINVYDIISTEQGNLQGPTEQGFTDRVAGHEGCTYDSHEPDCPRIIIAPIVDPFDTSGHLKVQVLGFAAFFIDSVSEEEDDKGSKKEIITGKYIGPYTVSGDTETDDTAEDYGVYAIKLID